VTSKKKGMFILPTIQNRDGCHECRFLFEEVKLTYKYWYREESPTPPDQLR